MKLIIAIIRDLDNDNLSHALTAGGYRVTTVASTGGFLRRGQTTMLIGVRDEQLEGALQVIRQTIPRTSEGEASKNATIFVLPVQDFIQI